MTKAGATAGGLVDGRLAEMANSSGLGLRHGGPEGLPAVSRRAAAGEAHYLGEPTATGKGSGSQNATIAAVDGALGKGAPGGTAAEAKAASSKGAGNAGRSDSEHGCKC
jgi:hypothetical protein